MGKVVVFKPADVGVKDNYQSSVGTNYYRDQTTGELFKTSGNNVRTIIPEQITVSKLIQESNTAVGGATSTLYTVPAGKAFILNYAAFDLSYDITGYAANQTLSCSLYIDNSLGNVKTLIPLVVRRESAFGTSQIGVKNLSISPSSLLIFDSGIGFYISSFGAGCATTGIISGYLVDKSQIYFNIPSYF